MIPRRRFLPPAVLLGALFATAAMATLVAPMELSERVASADHVVLARAERVSVVTDPQTRFHYTVTRFVVLEEAKGDLGLGARFELRLIGGRAPGSYYETVAPDVPRFREGEELILFTTRADDGQHLLVGLEGAVRLKDGPAGKTVRSPLVEGTAHPPAVLQSTPAPVRRAGTAAATAPRPVRGRERLSPPPVPSGVEAFLQRVREIAASRPEPRR